MHLLRCALAIVSLCLILSSNTAAVSQQRLRIAVLDFNGGDGQHSVEAGLRSALVDDGRATVLDPSQVAAAVAAGSTSSLNLTIDEARSIGATIGCDAYVLGKIFVEKTDTGGRTSYEIFAGLFLVDARTGQLIKFLPQSEHADTSATVLEKTLTSLKSKAATLVDLAVAFRDNQSKLPSAGVDSDAEDLPEENSPEVKGFAPPQFFRRYSPTYTEVAAHAEVTATVELSVVFRSDGKIGEIAVTRWAGFGLDEAAIETVRSMKFEPARRNGQAISVRAPVRYNFRSK